MKDLLIHDFTSVIFQNALKAYFAELDIEVANWDRFFSWDEHGTRQYWYRKNIS